MTRTHHWVTGFALVLGVALAICSDVRATGPVRPTPVVVHVERGGFRWSDAAIGALAGVGFSLAACGCLALVRLRGATATSPTRREQP